MITNTAALHAIAWKAVFDEYLESRRQRKLSGFKAFSIEDDYLQLVDGRPRYEGVQNFLKSRGIELEWGEPDDSLEAESIYALGKRKNILFLKLLEERGPQVFSDAVDQVQKWKAKGLRLAIVSASRNAKKVLDAAKIKSSFDFIFDGNDLTARSLRGKPEPDMYLEAAKILNVSPNESMVIEDAIAGVEAGKKGGFGIVVGVSRDGKNRDRLLSAGAEMVVADLTTISSAMAAQVKALEKRAPENFDSALLELTRKVEGKKVVVFLDYDGTLTPITSRPEEARLSEPMRQLLGDLAANVKVAIVSGRDLADVQKMVGLPQLIYAGSHGFDIAGPDDLRLQSEGGEMALPELNQIEREVREKTADIDGVWVERKRYAIAVHYRQSVADSEGKQVSRCIDELLPSYPGLRRNEGKKIVEIEPNIQWNKGKAILWLLSALDMEQEGVVPIYVGDDVTDEDAFFALKNIGVGILVSDEPAALSYADYRVESPKQVENVLKWLLEHSLRTLEEIETTAWKLTYNDFNPTKQGLRESLCTLGNGFFATRGAFEEASADDVHYPGTYLAGGYNRSETDISGRIVENEDLVNWPNWLALNFRVDDGDWFDLRQVQTVNFRQELDTRAGVLTRNMEFVDSSGRHSKLDICRFVDMSCSHIAGIRWVLTPLNWSGSFTIRSAIDARVENTGVERYRKLTTHHRLDLDAGRVGETGIFLDTVTKQSEIKVSVAARTTVIGDAGPLAVERTTHEEPGYIYQELSGAAQQHKEIKIEKMVTIYSSKDFAISQVSAAAKEAVIQTGSFESHLDSHRHAWSQIWNRCDLILSENVYSQLVLRLHIFHLLQTCSYNTADHDVGVPARGWHGEAYRGHVFWDELFIFPYYNLRLPELTRELLMYRYRRLAKARQLAKRAGYSGALFPWQSGSDGRDESQVIHLNPLTGRWDPDHTHLQRHIGAAIAFNVWQYYQSSQDAEFLSLYGSKLVLEIARFFASIAKYSPQKQRYEIHNVVGPDEFHTHYPDSNDPGLSNNAYTNIMVSWTLAHALKLLAELGPERQQELEEELSLTKEELRHWQDVSEKLYVPFHGDGIISQFEGYEKLKEFDWDGYLKRYGDIQRLDRILTAENDSPNNYKASKQADVLMLFYLFSTEELDQIFRRLGYEFSPHMIPQNIEYYSKRVSHGSTLSWIVHSWILSRLNRPKAWELFQQALKSDISDIQGGTTSEGIHLGAMAGTVDIMQRCFTGIEIRDQVLWFNPNLPEDLGQLKFRIRFRGQWLNVCITQSELCLNLEKGWLGPVHIGVQGEVFAMRQGESRRFSLVP